MSDDEQAIRTLIATWLRATREGDVETVLSLTTPDVVFLAPGQPPMQGREAFAAALRAVLDKHSIDSSSEIDEIEVCGDMAFCRTRLKVIVTSRHGNLPMERRGHTLSILRRTEDGQWLLARDANMLAPAQ
jgi:uncharacterized protein (TIGR02246 family)